MGLTFKKNDKLEKKLAEFVIDPLSEDIDKKNNEINQKQKEALDKFVLVDELDEAEQPLKKESE